MEDIRSYGQEPEDRWGNERDTPQVEWELSRDEEEVPFHVPRD